eukprot:5787984-Pleurochrysis_carterae.AAC.11
MAAHHAVRIGKSADGTLSLMGALISTYSQVSGSSRISPFIYTRLAFCHFTFDEWTTSRMDNIHSKPSRSADDAASGEYRTIAKVFGQRNSAGATVIQPLQLGERDRGSRRMFCELLLEKVNLAIEDGLDRDAPLELSALACAAHQRCTEGERPALRWQRKQADSGHPKAIFLSEEISVANLQDTHQEERIMSGEHTKHMNSKTRRREREQCAKRIKPSSKRFS